MTNRAQITRRAASDGVPAPTVERDYVLAHIVAALGLHGDDHGLVFKGGTALRLCYFGDYRYSADLDFSAVDNDIEQACTTIATALTKVGGAVTALSLSDTKPRRISYRGPLGRQRSLKLDITDRELVLNVGTVSLLPLWADLPDNILVRAYPLSEIAGEKLRCTMQRLQCRDLFDLWFLFDRASVDVRTATDIFIRKADHRNLDPDRFANNYRVRLPQYRDRWTTELGTHVPGDIPHFEHVERAVSRRLRAVGLL